MKKHLLLPYSAAFILSTTCINSFAHEEEDLNEFNPWYFVADRSQEGFEIGASLLWLQSELSTDLTQYAIFDTVASDGQVTENSQTLDVRDEYEFGFDVFLGYVWENGQDLMFEYTYYHDKGDSSGTCAFESTSNFQNCTAYPTGQHFHGDATSTISTNFNEADILFGQRFVVGEHMDLHFFAGVTASWIEVGIDQHFEELRGYTVGNDAFLDSTFNSDFRGVGPKVGLDGAYQIAGSPIYIFMEASFAGLIGQSTASYTDYVFDPEGHDTSLIYFDGGEETAIVPNINAEIGLLYKYEISDDYSGEIILGYLASEYFDAVRQLALYGSSAGNDNGNPIYNDTLIESESNYSLNGPYLTLSAIF